MISSDSIAFSERILNSDTKAGIVTLKQTAFLIIVEEEISDIKQSDLKTTFAHSQLKREIMNKIYGELFSEVTQARTVFASDPSLTIEQLKQIQTKLHHAINS